MVYNRDFAVAWTVTETTLQQDGAKSTFDDPSPARIIKYNTNPALEPVAVAEYIYMVSPRKTQVLYPKVKEPEPIQTTCRPATI